MTSPATPTDMTSSSSYVDEYYAHAMYISYMQDKQDELDFHHTVDEAALEDPDWKSEIPVCQSPSPEQARKITMVRDYYSPHKIFTPPRVGSGARSTSRGGRRTRNSGRNDRLTAY